MKINESLFIRRKKIEKERNRTDLRNINAARGISIEILQSWLRCEELGVKPLPEQKNIRSEELLQNTLLNQIIRSSERQLICLANEAQAALAIFDDAGRLLWVCSGQEFESHATYVNFVKGGCWSEKDLGTNAVGLALQLGCAASVFSSEHYLAEMQDYVTAAALLKSRKTGQVQAGIVVLMHWETYTPFILPAMEQLVSSIEGNIELSPVREGLEVYMLCQPKVSLNGELLSLSPRQLEILCLLILNPDGVSLKQLHAKLYGDHNVSLHTLKAEVSTLRGLLGGEIGSRPYRLMLSVYADFVDVFACLHEQRSHDAIALYRGMLLPFSDSPEIREWDQCIEVAISRAVDSCGGLDVLVEKQFKRHSGWSGLRQSVLDQFESDTN